MSEVDKVWHLLKGIAEDVYNYFIGKERLDSAADVIKHCRTFYTWKIRRITPKFSRLTNVATVAGIEDSYNVRLDLENTVRQVVREELQCHNKSVNAVKAAQFGCIFHQPHEPAPVVSSLSAMPGIADSRTDPLQQHHHPFPDDVTHDKCAYWGATKNWHLEDRVSYSQRPRAAYSEVYNVSRPSPICNSCGAIGHISRFCRRHHQTRYGPPPTWPKFKGVNDDHGPAEHRATNATG
ncbi:hypothetical protein HPB51_025026 [Rhipicephalus microplus]|uniref:CCHC-type domain-containing protein n=1 Tax=Rhipicephalus microplus TaxID=6941 RepID=A0A9J6DDY2_RHIMP|nr:hypothetical protein HPB51_025026 [Rhipicephalus microplus]